MGYSQQRMKHQAGHGLRRQRLRRPGHRAGAGAAGLSGAGGGAAASSSPSRSRPRAMSARSWLMRANLRMPQSVARAVAGSQAVINAAGIPFERGRQRYQAVHAEGARTIAQAARAAGVAAPGPYLGHRCRQPQLAGTAIIRSKVDAEDAVVDGFDGVTILRPQRGVRPQRRHVQPHGEHRRHGAVRACGRQRLGQACSRCSWATSARAAAAVLARPDTARSVFELGGPARLHLPRDRRAGAARDRSPEADHRRAAGLMKDRRLLRPADRHPRDWRSPITADQAELMRARQCGAARGAATLASLGHHAHGGGGHPADLSDRFRQRRPLQPARSGLRPDFRHVHVFVVRLLPATRWR